MEVQRKRMGYSREKLSDMLNVEAHTLFRWEKNHREPSDDMKWKIAELLGVDIAWLMGAGGDEPPQEVAAPVAALSSSPIRVWLEIDPSRIDRKKIANALSLLQQ